MLLKVLSVLTLLLGINLPTESQEFHWYESLVKDEVTIFSETSFKEISVGTFRLLHNSELLTKTVFFVLLFKVSIEDGNLNHKFEIPFPVI